MATNENLLAKSLNNLQQLQQQCPQLVLKGTEQLSRTHLMRLLEAGWLREVVKGWYIPTQPGESDNSADWQAYFWPFVKAYLESRYGEDWILSPESAIDFYTAKTILPVQLVVKSSKANGNVVNLPYGHSILPIKEDIGTSVVVESRYGLRLPRLVDALESSTVGNDSISERVARESVKSGQQAFIERLRQMWKTMRDDVIANFSNVPVISTDVPCYLADIDSRALDDVYCSLIIAGYPVDNELIERVNEGIVDDSETTLAIKGYLQAFNAVKTSITKILNGQNPGVAVASDLGTWNRQLRAPFVAHGDLQLFDLIGYRHEQIYISGARHIPPAPDIVEEAMGAFFDLLINEPDARVRAVLGHFMFMFIYPYKTGNGLISHFLLNAMFASGGHPWTVIPTQRRREYLDTMYRASADGNIIPLTRLISDIIGN
ncbi:MAG: Fic family protein [Muribaculaceae bacterium]|nr:Fic family protein [Muribaculaceae bacterium]